jgi:hypothetical protein
VEIEQKNNISKKRVQQSIKHLFSTLQAPKIPFDNANLVFSALPCLFLKIHRAIE